MKKSNNVIIIGCSIPSLYAGIKLIELGYKVTIIEKKNSYHPISQAAYHNFNLYNDNHKAYINLLKRYDIKSDKVNTIHFDEKLYLLINTIIQKSKYIPSNIVMTHTFTSLCKYLTPDSLNNDLNSYDNIFNGIFNIMNASDCINIFTHDLINQVDYYYLSNDAINELIIQMIKTFQGKYGKIIYSNEVKNIRFIKKKYVISTNMHHTFSCDIVMTTISKDNLSSFGFWNNDQKILLNSVTAINSSIISNMVNKLLIGNIEQDNHHIRDKLLDCMHIVYPLFTNKSKYIYIWNNGINNIIIREKIKTMYNDRFIICSESFSKNNMFINYSLEYIDSALMKIYKYS
jgi:hypothetical protein